MREHDIIAKDSLKRLKNEFSEAKTNDTELGFKIPVANTFELKEKLKAMGYAFWNETKAGEKWKGKGPGLPLVDDNLGSK